MKPHLFLNNPRGEQKKFNASRNIEKDTIPPKSPERYRFQKNKLNSAVSKFNSKQSERMQQRTIEVPAHIEYIRVDFFMVFNNTEPFKTKSRFKNQFGLVPVAYLRFNQSILFAISDNHRFAIFIKLLKEFIKSPDNQIPSDSPYAIMTTIYDFDFLSTSDVLENSAENDVILSLVKSEETINSSFTKIYSSLIEYINSRQKINNTIKYSTDSVSTVEISNIDSAAIRLIAENFDIIYKIQSLRVPTIKPNAFNIPELTWDIAITTPPAKQNVMIGVLDNGVSPIAPLANILLDLKLDITNKLNPNPLRALHPHGTIVSSLAALGLEYFNTEKKTFDADAIIVPMKILDFDTGFFNIYDIKALIKEAISKGVRIFNLSVCGPGKMYNSVVSEYAYMLDKLAYENDILIFIATGNLSVEDIEAMQANPPSGANENLHTYPNHFYNPNKSSPFHVCEASNLCLPGESYNNITVGAIADNMIANSPADLTTLKELPAFYTLKSHIDYNQEINGTRFAQKQINYNINKPDIVMPGGDLLHPDSGMQVFGLGVAGNDFYIRDSGTSFATPLAANLAAKIISLYPSLNMQSVKALILNSAHPKITPDFLDDLVAEIKEENSKKIFDKSFSELDKEEKKTINEKISSEQLYKRIVGFGTPEISKALYSDSKSVTTIIQDSIAVNSHKVINLNIPEYLLKYSKPSYILTLKAILCYKFLPVWNNHLGYNPLHISFNFCKSLKKNNPVETADLIADRDHKFYKKLVKKGASPEEISKARKKALGVKKNLQSWSEDFFPPATKPFSNTQHLELNIKVSEIRKVDKQISIAVRCTHKRELDKDIVENLLQSLHEFSIVLTISEKANNELKKFDLYDELNAVNDLQSAAIVELDSDIELDDH